ncbi:hypothetical protein E1B28_012902 [Marasmius oreades]|uniref:F-box domain-containing protein n=1 Tax=Marasmius oreades TaxID=181124 RepID=A0A9P7RT23_9AGAR|nr:uncharacterized protein E1B28_012902 [Marasmius oreades]KAG7088957.1 hypothetical protein E1B28_012902 [Marasmius oreades]
MLGTSENPLPTLTQTTFVDSSYQAHGLCQCNQCAPIVLGRTLPVLNQSTLVGTSDVTYNLGHHGAYAVTLTPHNRSALNELAGVPLLTSKLPDRQSIYPSHDLPYILTTTDPGREPPVKRLPAAILSYIFVLAHHREEPLYANFTYMCPFHALAFPWVVSSVCLQWHIVARNTKELWRKITISTGDHFTRRWVVNGYALRRWMLFFLGSPECLNPDQWSAYGSGMDVHLRTSASGFSNTDYQVLLILLEYSHYWRTLRLETHRPALSVIQMKGVHASSLETLDISLFCGDAVDIDLRATQTPSFPSLFLSAPKLKNLYASEASRCLHSFRLPWEQLDSIRITHCGLEHDRITLGLWLLANTMSIKTVQLEAKRSAPTKPTMNALIACTMFRNPSVQVFEYCCPEDEILYSNPFAIHVFDRLLLPNLKELILRDDSHPQSFQAARNMILRSKASISHLTVFGVLSRQGLYQLLEVVEPSIESLTVGINPLEAHYAFTSLEIINWFDFPRLKELTFVIRASPLMSYLATSPRWHRARCIRTLLNIIERRWPSPAIHPFGGNPRRRGVVPAASSAPLTKSRIVFRTSDLEIAEVLGTVLQDFDRGNVEVGLERVDPVPRLVVDPRQDAFVV